MMDILQWLSTTGMVGVGAYLVYYLARENKKLVCELTEVIKNNTAVISEIKFIINELRHELKDRLDRIEDKLEKIKT